MAEDPGKEVDEAARWRLTGGKPSKCGTPQGGVIQSAAGQPVYNRFLKHWRLSRMGEKLAACLVNYADDFVILNCLKAREALAWTRQVLTRLGLALNEAKTCIRRTWEEGFDFLG